MKLDVKTLTELKSDIKKYDDALTEMVRTKNLVDTYFELFDKFEKFANKNPTYGGDGLNKEEWNHLSYFYSVSKKQHDENFRAYLRGIKIYGEI